MTIKTPAEIAQGVVTENGSISDSGEPLFSLSLGSLTAYNIREDQADLMQEFATAAIEADRAQLAERLRESIRHHNDDASNPEYLRGQVEMAAYIIGYSDPGEGDALRDDLTSEAGK